MEKYADDFLKQLDINKNDADEKISNSIFGGYLGIDGAKNARNIAFGNRKAVAQDLLSYVKQYVNTDAFIRMYNEMRNYYKPKEQLIQTPEEWRIENIKNHKEIVAKAEEIVKNSNPEFKDIFQKNLDDAKKQLKDAEDANNKYFVNYKSNYPQLVKDFKSSYDRSISNWKTKYPDNQLLFVKMRLQQFLDVTKDVDFSAELIDKGNKKIFANPDYERKDNRWKMAFRAGKEVVESSREFVQKWMNEIK